MKAPTISRIEVKFAFNFFHNLLESLEMMTEPEDVGLFFCLNDLEPRMVEVSVDDVIAAEHL